MKTTKRLLSLLFVMAFVASASASFASKADDLLKDAAAAVSKAHSAKSTTDKDEHYKKARDLYAKVDKQFVNTPQGASALYLSALVDLAIAADQPVTPANVLDVLKSPKFPKNTTSNLYAAHEVQKRLINIYDKPQAKLEETLTKAEASQVLSTVAAAHALKTATEATLDRINSTDWKYKILDFFVNLTGRIPAFSYWFAIILVTCIVKVLLTPLTKAQFKAMKEMQKVAPLIKEIQAKFKGDQKTIGEKTMELYKEHKINPFASCLPLLVQMPILMFLYYTIRSYEFQFSKATFLWIGSGLSHLTSFPVMFNPGTLVWVTAKNLSEPDLILVLLYVVSMYISTKLSAVDPTQAEQQKMMAIVMPVMFAFIFAGFPSAFLLYWLVFNILQTAQQYMILRPGPADAIVAQVPPTKPEDEDGGSRVRRRRRR